MGLEEVNGVISTGKESVIFHGRSHVEECVLKVFKTTLTEFTQRQQFLHGDRRFESRVGKQPARKLVKVWAEKEMANLMRMRRAGMDCPSVILHKKHVLIMSFIGRDGHPAPKLKDVKWSQKRLDKCFQQVMEGMATMYRECQLVHCDLSEYNMLYWEDRPWFIDVGQAVEPNHPRAQEYLFRDCVNVHRFFAKAGASDLISAADMFTTITGQSISTERQADFQKRISCPGKGRIKRSELEAESAMGESSNVVLKPDAVVAHEVALASDHDANTSESSEWELEGDELAALEAAMTEAFQPHARVSAPSEAASTGSDANVRDVHGECGCDDDDFIT